MGDIEMAGSFMIAGMMLITIMAVNAEILETSALNAVNTMAQENATEISSIIEYDLDKIGYAVPSSTVPFLIGTDSTITFLADIDKNGTVDTIAYRLGPASEVTVTDNPNDRYLYRSVNGTEYDVGLGITEWTLTYYDSALAATTTLSSIRSVKFAFTVQSTYGYDEQYGRSYFERRIIPKNLIGL